MLRKRIQAAPFLLRMRPAGPIDAAPRSCSPAPAKFQRYSLSMHAFNYSSFSSVIHHLVHSCFSLTEPVQIDGQRTCTDTSRPNSALAPPKQRLLLHAQGSRCMRPLGPRLTCHSLQYVPSLEKQQCRQLGDLLMYVRV